MEPPRRRRHRHDEVDRLRAQCLTVVALEVLDLEIGPPPLFRALAPRAPLSGLAAAGWVRDVRGVWTNMPIVTGNGMNL